MNPTTAITRIIAGIAVIGVAAFVYFSNRGKVAGSDLVMIDLFGSRMQATPGQLTLAFGAAFLVGVVLLLLGIVGLTRR